jgi:hypothetical protein
MKKPAIVAIVVAICALVGGGTYGALALRHKAGATVLGIAHASPAVERPVFPDIDTAGLSAQRLRILALAREEYNKNPVSFDQNVLKYRWNPLLTSLITLAEDLEKLGLIYYGGGASYVEPKEKL